MSETVDSGQGAESVPTPLADIFSRGSDAPAVNDAGQASEATEAAAAPEPGETADAGQQRDANGRFAAKEPAQTDAAPPAAESEPASVPIAALKDERAKRQQAEAELARLREQTQQAQVPSMPSPTEDPEGFKAYIAAPAFQRLLHLSERAARKQHGDEIVEARFATYQDALQSDPGLRDRMLQADDPWGAMMQEAARIEARKEIGDDPVAYRERVRQELLAEMQATKPAAPAETAQPTLPKSLATERSVGARTPDSFTGPTPLNQIVRLG